jgi:hypothetical protein
VTLDQFLGKLRATPRGWEIRWIHVAGSGISPAIRFRVDPVICSCPISYLHPDGPAPASDFCRAAERLELDPDLTVLVAEAADNQGSLKIRAQLLEACGLQGAE